ncbi:S-adenosyl-L-methionine-dependent methyltransferase [Glonium stellatum]|uniref:tRNA (adenine(58)-N(1))-methyltransferase catalytic subunit TRM61 n=1 Tax=Glonium stellatum TaxID=574774 RepID=A0A8E2ESN3_9PEZI|nr:S-adenosyl-L-methionine-dependent methyltransferase [Glonium stellatum]
MIKTLLPFSKTPLSTVRICRRKPITLCHQCFRKLATDGRVFEEGDIALLREKHDASHDGHLSKPLHSKKTIETHRGPISHTEIIGKRVRDIIKTKKGHEYRIHEPTLSEYVRYTPRSVTPIYPQDANVIVSLLDIHVSPQSDSTPRKPPLEILEAGTGHGALTLHLSRAIHAANPPLPSPPPYLDSEDGMEDSVYQGESVADPQHSELEAWKKRRQAIIHTLDISPNNTNRARNVVKGFRRGMYAGNVEFHIGDVSAWIAAQTKMRNTSEPFLSHVLLDLPGAQAHLANVAPALHTNGALAVFNPSITQIVECVEMIRDRKLPYLLDRVVELGGSTAGREWDVRAVRPRVALRKENGLGSVPESPDHDSDGSASVDQSGHAIGGYAAGDKEMAKDMNQRKSDWAMICRPKVGYMVVGGGFLGVWRRMKDSALGSD